MLQPLMSADLRHATFRRKISLENNEPARCFQRLSRGTITSCPGVSIALSASVEMVCPLTVFAEA